MNNKTISLVIIFVLVSTFKSYSQISESELVPKEDGQIRITRVVQAKGMSHKDIKQGFVNFMTSNAEYWGFSFSTPSRNVKKITTLPVFAAKNELENDSTIMYKCQFSMPKNTAALSLSAPSPYDKELITFTVSGFFKDDRYKLEVSNMVHTNTMDPQNSSGGRFENIKPEWHDLKGKKAWEDLKKKSLIQLGKIIQSLEENINKSKSDKYNF